MGKRIHYVRTVSETESRQLRTLASSRTQPRSACPAGTASRQYD